MKPDYARDEAAEAALWYIFDIDAQTFPSNGILIIDPVTPSAPVFRDRQMCDRIRRYVKSDYKEVRIFLSSTSMRPHFI